MKWLWLAENVFLVFVFLAGLCSFILIVNGYMDAAWRAFVVMGACCAAAGLVHSQLKLRTRQMLSEAVKRAFRGGA